MLHYLTIHSLYDTICLRVICYYLKMIHFQNLMNSINNIRCELSTTISSDTFRYSKVTTMIQQCLHIFNSCCCCRRMQCCESTKLVNDDNNVFIIIHIRWQRSQRVDRHIFHRDLTMKMMSISYTYSIVQKLRTVM